MEGQIEELRRTLAQVHHDSQEIERELEAELQARDEACKDLQTRLATAVAEAREWKLQTETLRTRTKALEEQNDDYEQSARIHEASIERLENENQRLLELLAFAEVDRSQHQATEVELQRTKQKLTDAEEDVSKLKRQVQLLSEKRKPCLNPDSRKSRSKLAYDKLQSTELRSRDWVLGDAGFLAVNAAGPLVSKTQVNTIGHGTTVLSSYDKINARS